MTLIHLDFAKTKQVPAVRAVTFGCPGVLSKDVADSSMCEQFITSYVADLDMVSRLSYVHMSELREECIIMAGMVSGKQIPDTSSEEADGRVKLYPPRQAGLIMGGRNEHRHPPPR